MNKGEFSVYAFRPDGQYMELLRFVPPEEAIEEAIKQIVSIGAVLGTVHRVIITDGGDCTNFEWIRGQGVIFPPEATNGRTH